MTKKKRAVKRRKPRPAADQHPSTRVLRMARHYQLPLLPITAHEYLYRIAGIARRFKVYQSMRSPKVVLVGQFVAVRNGERFVSRYIEVPEDLAGQVRQVFREHPKRVTRDRIEVYVDYDVWAVPDSGVIGYRLVSEGEAWVPEPFSQLVAQAVARPQPTSPSYEGAKL